MLERQGPRDTLLVFDNRCAAMRAMVERKRPDGGALTGLSGDGRACGEGAPWKQHADNTMQLRRACHAVAMMLPRTAR